jgi:hypothetical protein
MSDSVHSEERSTDEDPRNEGAPAALAPEDFYYESGLIVFTAAYHLKRGYCCNSGCRHCPFR